MGGLQALGPGSGWVLAPVVLALAACGGAPPVPVGSVVVHGVPIALSAPPGLQSVVPLEPQATIQLGLEWSRAPESDTRSLALGHLELLRDPPSPGTARTWGDRIRVPTCSSRRLAALVHALDGALGPALEQLGPCREDDDRRVYDALLQAYGIHGELGPSGVDARALHRQAATLLLDARRQGVVSDALREVTEAHVEAFALPGARAWWRDAVGPEVPEDWLDALGALEHHTIARPKDPEEGARASAALLDLSRRLRSRARGLPAARAAYIAAWYADVSGLDSDPAWRWLAEVARDRWPWFEAQALNRLSRSQDTATAAGHAEAWSLLERAGEIARRHRLRATEVALLSAAWQMDARPALAVAEVAAFLDVLRRAEGLDEEARSGVLARVGNAAWLAGWPRLARAACEEAVRGPDGSCPALACDDVLAFLTPLEERAATMRAATLARGDCISPKHALIRHATLAEVLHRTGAPAEAELQRAREAAARVGDRWPLFVEAVAILMDEGAPAALDTFDGLASGAEEPDHRGWVTIAYRSLILQEVARGADLSRLWSLLARRESVRLQADVEPFPDGIERIAVIPSELDDMLVLTGEGTRVFEQDGLPETFLDRAGAQAAAWVTGSPRGPELEQLRAVLDLSGEGTLLQVGSGSELDVPLAVLGVDRPTAQWVPVSVDRARWDAGVVVSGTAEGGALYGVKELMATRARDGWTTGSAKDLAQLQTLVADQPVVHITAHGGRLDRSRAGLMLGPGLIVDADLLARLPLQPGALVVLAACEAAGGTAGDLSHDLPLAAFEAGAGAVLYSRYPVRSVPLHRAAEMLYAQLPFPCAELPTRWHQIRRGFDRQLLGVDVAVSASCMTGGQ